jgi:hypothetical protein
MFLRYCLHLQGWKVNQVNRQQDIDKIVETSLNVCNLSLCLNVFRAVIKFICYTVCVFTSPCLKGQIFVSSHIWLTNTECFVLLLNMVCPPLKLAFKIWECIIFYIVPHRTKWQTPTNSMLPTSDIQRAEVRVLTFGYFFCYSKWNSAKGQHCIMAFLKVKSISISL